MENKNVLSSLSVDELKELILNVVRSEFERLRVETHTKQQPKQELFLTAQQAAKYLGISLSTLHRYKDSGLLPCVWIRHLLRFKKSDIDVVLKKLKGEVI